MEEASIIERPFGAPTLKGDVLVPSIRLIIDTVCVQYNLSYVEICGNCRQRHLIVPRHIAYWLCKKLTMASYPEIGRKFNNRDHTTIMHGAKKIQIEVDAKTWIGDDAQTLAKYILEDMQ